MNKGSTTISYTFTTNYDYAIVSGYYGRDGNANRGLAASVSGCAYQIIGTVYGPMSDNSCEGGIITIVLNKPTSRTSVSIRSATSGAAVGISVVGITL